MTNRRASKLAKAKRGPRPGPNIKVPAPGQQIVVHGVRCSWWDTIDKASRICDVRGGESTMPCCPHCGSVLLECPSLDEWWRSAREHEASDVTNLNYVRFLEWARGKCFGRFENAIDAYQNSDQMEPHPYEPAR